jgi:eukaryotic-like serine/threonine-protein kinase
MGETFQHGATYALCVFSPRASAVTLERPMVLTEQDPLALVGVLVSGKYRVERFVAEGGFSYLYRAEHAVWKQPVLLKFLKLHPNMEPARSQQLIQEFLREGALLRELSARSASIIQAYDVESFVTRLGELPFLVLEWLDGAPLDQHLAQDRAIGRPPNTLEEALHLLEPIALALEVVHGRGIAHCDIKPGNIFIVGDPYGPDAIIKLLDFGIAKMMSQEGGSASFTPHYGAPEQFDRSYGETGPWTDVFALALVLVEMLAGRRAIEGADVSAAAFSSMNPSIRPTPAQLGAPIGKSVEAVFQRALAVAPQQRYPNAAAFWTELKIASAEVQTLMSAPAPSGPSGQQPFSETPAVQVAVARQPSLPARNGGAKKLLYLIPVAMAAAAIGAFLAVRSEGPNQPLGAASAGPSAANSAEAALVAPSASAAPVELCPAGMVPVRAGKFFMGHDGDEVQPFERPQHQVTLGAFCMDVTEVTVEAYRVCVESGKCQAASVENSWPGMTKREQKLYDPICNYGRPGRDRHPINCVDWEKANTFCAASGKRLPTSAEWEYAVRGSDGRVYPWGDEPPSANHLNACGAECVAWGRAHRETLSAMHPQDDGFATTAPVGSFPRGRSMFGLDDVIGNVMEWVSDWDGPYTADPKTDPQGPSTGVEKVIRGGAWNAGNMVWVRPSFRFHFPPASRTHGIGFRCAKAQQLIAAPRAPLARIVFCADERRPGCPGRDVFGYRSRPRDADPSRRNRMGRRCPRLRSAQAAGSRGARTIRRARAARGLAERRLAAADPRLPRRRRHHGDGAARRVAPHVSHVPRARHADGQLVLLLRAPAVAVAGAGDRGLRRHSRRCPDAPSRRLLTPHAAHTRACRPRSCPRFTHVSAASPRRKPP